MARIYYHEEKLSGQAFGNEVVNLKLFDFIFDNTNTNKFEIKPVSIHLFFGLIKSKKETFKTVKVLRDGINYDTKEGSFYLPKALIFYDNEDYNFPSKFYFIAKLKDKIEIRKCNGGEDVKWFQIPDLHQEITDVNTIQKIENTLLEVKKRVETTDNIQIDIDRKKEKEAQKITIEENQPLLNESQKKAYKELTDIVLGFNPKKDNVIEFIEKLKNHDENSEYISALNYVMDFLDENEVSFIFRLDWKAGIEDLEWALKFALKNNFNLSLELPKTDDYDKNAYVSSNNVFEDFNKPLRLNGLQIGFIDMESDEYVFILHSIEDKEKVEKILNKIGYDYYEK